MGEIPTEYGIDFSTGQLTGGKVSGAKAVAVWAWNALMYPRYRYELATWQYGSELSKMIGKVMDKSRASMIAESLVRDALLPNENILDIKDFACELKDDKLIISFRIVTPFGEEELRNVAIR